MTKILGYQKFAAQGGDSGCSRFAHSTKISNVHLPVLDAGKVVGLISIGDVVKDIIRDLEHNVGDLMGYIMRDGPGG